MANKQTGLVFLYNGLYAISSNYKDLEHLESPIFEVMDEIDSCIVTGFSDQALQNYSDSGIEDGTVNELRRFRDFVGKIDNEYWNPDDFDSYEDWKIARSWATSLLGKLGMTKRSWNTGNTKIVYTK